MNLISKINTALLEKVTYYHAWKKVQRILNQKNYRKYHHVPNLFFIRIKFITSGRNGSIIENTLRIFSAPDQLKVSCVKNKEYIYSNVCGYRKNNGIENHWFNGFSSWSLFTFWVTTASQLPNQDIWRLPNQ